MLMRIRDRHELKVSVLEADRESLDRDRVAKVLQINRQYDCRLRDIDKMRTSENECFAVSNNVATIVHEELRAKLQLELERISACNLVGCGVDDVILLIVSTGARPNEHIMRSLNVDSAHVAQFSDEVDVKESTGIKECGDLYRVLQCIRSVISGHGVPARFDLKGREGLADNWGMDRACEWLDVVVIELMRSLMSYTVQAAGCFTRDPG